MTGKIWYEEVLLPPKELAEETVKGLVLCEAEGECVLRSEKALDFDALEAAPDKAKFIGRFVEKNAQGILRVQEPRWRPLTHEEVAGLPTGMGDIHAGNLAQGALYLVRLGMEFDVPPESKEAGWHYRDAWCRVHLFNPAGGVQPRVLDIFPKRIYEGSPTTVKVGVGLGLSAGPLDAKVAEVTTDLHVGLVTPVTLGFFGEEERAPYWELRSKGFPILGSYDFWMIVERPAGCSQARLVVLGDGNLRSSLFTIPVGPEVRVPEKRKSIKIAA